MYCGTQRSANCRISDIRKHQEIGRGEARIENAVYRYRMIAV
jgi:hypothetical protein